MTDIDIVERLRGKYMPGDWGHLAAVAADEIMRLRSLLAEMPDLIKDIDGGNPETSTGWASEELCDLWMRVRRALEPKP